MRWVCEGAAAVEEYMGTVRSCRSVVHSSADEWIGASRWAGMSGT